MMLAGYLKGTARTHRAVARSERAEGYENYLLLPSQHRPFTPLSGGGVTAGIDFVLALIAELCGRRAAEMVQLSLEYAPQPPFNSGRPDTAPAEVLEAVNARIGPSRAQRRARLDAWAAARHA